MLKVTAKRNIAQRTDGYDVDYSSTVKLGDYDIPVQFKLQGEGTSCPTVTEFHKQLLELMEDHPNPISSNYPKGVSAKETVRIHGVSFYFETMPMAPIEVLLPLAWRAFHEELKADVFHYDITGYDYWLFDNMVRYSSVRASLDFTYTQGHDLYDVLEEILLSFTLGKIEANTWTYQSETYGPLTIIKSFDEIYGRDLDPKSAVSELYRIYTGMK